MLAMQAEKATILAAITTLAANYGRTLPDQLVKVWVAALSQFTGQQVVQACYSLMLDRSTMPPLAAIIKAIPGRGVPKVRSPEELIDDQAWCAWHTVLQAVTTSSTPPSFSAETEIALRSAGGWHALLMAPESQLEWYRRTFIEAYRRVARYGAATWSKGALALAETTTRLGQSGDTPATTYEGQRAEVLQ